MAHTEQELNRVSNIRWSWYGSLVGDIQPSALWPDWRERVALDMEEAAEFMNAEDQAYAFNDAVNDGLARGYYSLNGIDIDRTGI